MEDIQQVGKVHMNQCRPISPECTRTCEGQDGGSFCPRRYELVPSGCEGRRGQGTRGECLGRSNQSWSRPAPPLTEVPQSLLQFIPRMMSSIYRM